MTLVATDSRPIRSTAARMAAPRPSLAEWLLRSPLYALTLGYRTPKSFFAVSPDSWPGSGDQGRRIMAGEYMAASVVGRVQPNADDAPWRRPGAHPLWLASLNEFGWLRDLRDSGEAGPPRWRCA